MKLKEKEIILVLNLTGHALIAFAIGTIFGVNDLSILNVGISALFLVVLNYGSSKKFLKLWREKTQ
jgi:hypothetical protein